MILVLEHFSFNQNDIQGLVTLPNFDDIQEAYTRLAQIANKTPVMTSRTLDLKTGGKVFLKCENFQRMGAFKFRGAFNAISQLSDQEKDRGVIAHSSGNHAQAVALVCKILGIKSVIIMPKNAPLVKVNATKGYGAKIVFSENTLEDRIENTMNLINEKGLTLIHPYDNENVIAGAGTAAYEFLEEINNLDLVLCPIGGGGFISGTSLAVKGMSSKTNVIGVEPALADDAYRSFKSSTLLPNKDISTIADGLRTSLSQRTFRIIQQNVSDIVLVTEKEIIDSMRFIWERMKIIVEPSGAVSLAPILSKKLNIEGKNVGVMISGGNIDLTSFFELLCGKIK